MQVLETVPDMRTACFRVRQQSDLVGLVPTMGALHAGHLSLIERARQDDTVVAVSLFINPLQFGPNEDFDRYPQQRERDLSMMREAGVSLVFMPSVREMYPEGATTAVEVGELGGRLDGASRPGHFRGVATVVAKLFHIVQPAYAYFGQKDAVQVAVLRRMVRDLNFDLDMVVCPIVRDEDGLALSSRNAYLSAEERQAALALPRALEAIRKLQGQGVWVPQQLIAAGQAVLDAEPAVTTEYLTAVDASTLLPVDRVTQGTLIAVAARVGTTRLIDNFITMQSGAPPSRSQGA